MALYAACTRLEAACTSLPYLFAPAMLVWNYMGLTEKGGLSHE
jgi:hypothetical protein